MTGGAQTASDRGEPRPARIPRVLALAGIPPSKLGGARFARISRGQRELYHWVLRRFAASGHPSGAEAREEAARLGLDAESAFEALRREDLVHRSPDAEITVAYPVSGRPTAHRVRLTGGKEVHAMCAIDALGIAPMLGERVEIRSREPLTGENIEVELSPEGEGRWLAHETVVPCGASGHGTSSSSCCPVLNFFASTENAERWLAARPKVRGEVISMPEAIAAGRTVFGDLLKEE